MQLHLRQAAAGQARGHDLEHRTGLVGDVHRKAEPGRAGSLDSAGFARMVDGYRAGYPLQGKDIAGTGLARLQPGNLVFFSLADRPGSPVSRVGVFPGIDSDGHRRVPAGRKSADGPTFDRTSCLDGTGRYARGFRAAKRLSGCRTHSRGPGRA